MTNSKRIQHPAGGNLNRINTLAPQIGIVKDNIDVENMGRLKVWIKGSSTIENDPTGWITCSYASPFAGASNPELLGNNTKIWDDTQDSYGFWAIPPDLNNLVIVMFINGDIKQAVWVSCLYQKDMNYMVPGLAEGASYQNDQYGGTAPPVAEYNKFGNADHLRPAYTPLADGLKKQGLLGDSFRGAGTSSARRESPSNVFGLKTPNGNQFVMDDGDGSELIRLRTKSGAQILISETVGSIYFINRDGTNWVELGADGNLDFYAGGGFNVHALGDINLKAGGSVNLEGSQVNLKSSGNININADGSLTELSLGDTTSSVHGKYTTVRMGDEQTYRKAGTYKFIHDTLPHTPIDIIDNSPPALPLPTSHQHSVKGDNSQETPAASICGRVPDSEPWSGHASVTRIVRDSVEDSGSKAKRGSVTENASMPLPVVGSPSKGMKAGVYAPKGYDTKDQPVYTFVGTTTAAKPVSQLVTSDEGVAFIVKQEGGFSSTKYPDGKGYSIGYGHLIKDTDSAVVKSGVISKEVAVQLLKDDLKYYESFVRKYVTVPLTQSQFDALVSFTYNNGPGSPSTPKTRKGLWLLVNISKLNEGNYADVPTKMAGFVTGQTGANSPRRVLPVLVKRRREEGLLFSRPVATNN